MSRSDKRTQDSGELLGFTLQETAQGIYEVKGSRFLSFLTPSAQEDSLLQSLKSAHPKAVHFVRASRILNHCNQITESFSDDGEPKGSSGMPCLNVLRGENLLNCACIVVRYFGGTLLGVGGLVRAYTNALQNCVQEAKTRNLLSPLIPQGTLSLTIPYSQLSKLEYEAKKLGLNLQKSAFLESSVQISLLGAQNSLDLLKNKL